MIARPQTIGWFWVLVGLSGMGCAADARVLSSEDALSQEGVPDDFNGNEYNGERVFGIDQNASGTHLIQHSGEACEGIAGGGTGRCDANNWSCEDGLTNIVTYTTLACDEQAGLGGDPNAEPWQDCADALAHGRSGDACARNFACARPAEDACCVDVAVCTSDFLFPWPGSSPPASGLHLMQTRACQVTCGALAPDPEREPATDCASVRELDAEGAPVSRVDRPCQGDFVCTNAGSDLSGAGVVDMREPVPGSDLRAGSGLRWCRDGLVLGIE